MKHAAWFLLAVFPLAGQSLTVATFNVRYPEKRDGANTWEVRKDLLVATVRQMDPDLMGVQELFKVQGDYIAGKLPAYAWLGVSRRGNTEDEYSALFYKKDRFQVVEHGEFWLSETPGKVGSTSWNMSLPRMATWALLADARGGGQLYFVNTHFAHRREDEDARQRGARVIQDWLGTLPPSVPVILTGDFNSGAEAGTYQVMINGFGDAWKLAPRRAGPEGTFHGFGGKPGAERIDWIFLRGPWIVQEAATVTHNDNGRYPSDHFPVRALVELFRSR